MIKRWWSDFSLWLAALTLGSVYKVVDLTTRKVREGGDGFYDVFERNQPVIIALWHGEHFLFPFMRWGRRSSRILLTTHRDGEILARACRLYGLGTIRGSGDHGREFLRKRAVRAFVEMVRALKGGSNIVMTADVPKVARIAGLGIVTLAKHSGRPIIPVAIGTSRRHRLANWDKTCISLPFGRMAMAHGEPVWVAPDSDDAALEQARRAVEASMHAVTVRAYALADAAPHLAQSQLGPCWP